MLCNMDSVDPNMSSEVIDQSRPPDVITGSMECKGKCEYEQNTISEEVACSTAAINGEIGESLKENPSIVVSALENDIQQEGSIPIDRCLKIESEFRENHALTNQNQDSMTENVEAGQAGPFDQSSNFLSGSMQIEKENENSVEATAPVSTEPVLKEAQNNSEAFQHHGIRRRCLQFEEALDTAISNQPAQSPSYSGGPKSPLETPLTPIKGKQTDTIQPVYPRNMNTTVKIPKPSGIGLHLNSIINVVQAGSGAIIHVKSARRCNFSITGKKSTPIINSYLSDSSNSSSVFTVAENVSASMDDNRHESHASLAVDSVTILPTNIVKSSNNSIILNPVDDQSTPGDKRMYTNTEADGGSEDFKSSPKKKRKKSSDSSDGDGCKRCNCKKSRCLKLYCDCFAAGMYCAEPCACQGCYNRPEYEDAVLETRQQIESRNPLAFAPKIVQHIIEPPTSNFGEVGTLFTPSSARHKRGCNCKKSMCLKKYCECYQANVGCSDGCRCEGCKNVYGQKGEYGMDNDVLSKEGSNERTDGSSIEKLSGNGGSFRSELCNPHNLTPLTPAVQLSNQRKDPLKAWLHSGQQFQSPESSLTFITPHAVTQGSPRNLDNTGMILETAGEILDLASDQELYYGNAETLDEFSNVCHRPRKSGYLYGVPNPQEHTNNSKAQSFSGKNHYSSVSSLSWRGSPNTPMAQSSASKSLKAVDLDSELSNTTQDDTPDILKDSSAPLNAVKVSSPNKKRISPPHAPQHAYGSSLSLDGLRTGRKFILKAVPSFPPLTPCVDSKSAVAQEKNEPQNRTSNK